MLSTKRQVAAVSPPPRSLLEIITAAGAPGISAADLGSVDQEKLDDLECKGLISRAVGRDAQGNEALVYVYRG